MGMPGAAAPLPAAGCVGAPALPGLLGPSGDCALLPAAAIIAFVIEPAELVDVLAAFIELGADDEVAALLCIALLVPSF
jgi:hypothetical protein